MKRRLFAAAMAMTMVMASSIPAMADITGTTENPSAGEEKSTQISVTAHVEDVTPRTSGSIENRNGDKDKNVWSIAIQTDTMNYELRRVDATARNGYTTYTWNTQITDMILILAIPARLILHRMSFMIRKKLGIEVLILQIILTSRSQQLNMLGSLMHWEVHYLNLLIKIVLAMILY